VARAGRSVARRSLLEGTVAVVEMGVVRAGVRCAASVFAGLLALAPATAGAADPPDPGQTTAATIVSNGSEYEYLRYVPNSYSPERPAPLVVAAHGCQTTAEQMMGATALNKLAERKGFVVLYPDVDAVSRALPGPLNQCWKFFDPSAYFRGNSDPAAIAAMTQAVIGELNIDTERVYIVGVSAGGLMAAVDAAAYSEIYAAVGIVASAGFADGTCFTTGVGTPVGVNATLAYTQMGPRARVVPIIAIGSDADLAFPATCTEKALEQGLRTNNLVLSGSQEGPIALSPAAVEEKQVPGGLAYTVSTFRDPGGCLIGERWIIHGMPHAWPGGPIEFEGYTDPRAPSGAEASWAFFKRYRKADTGMPCAETAEPVTCPSRTVTVKLRRAARVRRVRARVNGRRVPTSRQGRRVTLTLPAGPEGDVHVRLRVKRKGHAHPRILRRSFGLC